MLQHVLGNSAHKCKEESDTGVVLVSKTSTHPSAPQWVEVRSFENFSGFFFVFFFRKSSNDASSLQCPRSGRQFQTSTSVSLSARSMVSRLNDSRSPGRQLARYQAPLIVLTPA